MSGNDRNIHKLAKPILRTWASESHLESMALLEENAVEWMFDNYINLIGARDDFNKFCLEIIPRHDPASGDVTLCSWMRCPFIEFYSVSHNYVKKQFGSILDYIIYTLDKGFNIYMKMAQESLSVKMDVPFHSPFIYGYDKKLKLLYVADHYNNQKYALAQLGFDEFVKAYELTYWDSNGYQLLEKGDDKLQECELIQIARPRPYKYEFNLDWFLLQLRDYLNAGYRLDSVAAVSPERGYKRYFGFNCYNLLLEYVESFKVFENQRKDWRLFTMLCDHKNLFKMRLDFILQRHIADISDIEIPKCDWLSQTSEKILSLFLKYKVSGKTDILDRIQKLLNEMKPVEFELLCSIQRKLESASVHPLPNMVK